MSTKTNDGFIKTNDGFTSIRARATLDATMDRSAGWIPLQQMSWCEMCRLTAWKGDEIMCTNNPYRFGRSIYANLVACALALGVGNAYGDGGSAERQSFSPRQLEAHAVALRSADLEKAFWICDFAATTRGVDDTPAEFCSAVYDEIKTRKFGGDFKQLLGWWQQNKPAEHEKLASSVR